MNESELMISPPASNFHLYMGIAFGVLLLLGMALLRMSKPQQRTRPKPRGPANIRYVCAKCAGEFTHSNRTISAWEKGSRRFFCNPCHKTWRLANPAQETTPTQSPKQEPSGAGPAPSPSAHRQAMQGTRTQTPARVGPSSSGKPPIGCLGVALLLVLVPAAMAWVTLSA